MEGGPWATHSYQVILTVKYGNIYKSNVAID